MNNPMFNNNTASPFPCPAVTVAVHSFPSPVISTVLPSAPAPVTFIFSGFISVTFSLVVTLYVAVLPAFIVSLFGFSIAILGASLSNSYGPYTWYSTVLFSPSSSCCFSTVSPPTASDVFSDLSFIVFTHIYLLPVSPVPIVIVLPLVYSVHSPSGTVTAFPN